MKEIARLVLLHCGIFDPSMSALGHFRQIGTPLTLTGCPLRPKSGHARACLVMLRSHRRVRNARYITLSNDLAACRARYTWRLTGVPLRLESGQIAKIGGSPLKLVIDPWNLNA